MATLAASARGALVSFLAAAWTAACTSSANSPTSTGADPQSSGQAGAPAKLPGDSATGGDKSVLVSAGAQPPAGTGVSALVGADGGWVTLGDLTLSVSSGLLTSPQTITISVEPSPRDWAAYSNIYRFQPDGFVFPNPVEVRIPFSGDASLAVVHWSRLEDSAQFDTLTTTIDGAFAVAKVSHFSRGFVGVSTLQPSIRPCKITEDCLPYAAANYCSGSWYCVSGQCKEDPNSAVACDATFDTPCSKNTCNPETGDCATVDLSEGAACDDGNPCTTGEKCVKGSCEGNNSLCECLNSSECASKEDGNLCNGTLYCAKSKFPYQCVINPASVVSCSTAGDPQCQVNTCNPAIGSCALAAGPNGIPCDDGNACTAVDTCVAGACVGTGNACECQSDAACAVKEDGNVCNGTLFCNKATGKCQLNPATEIICPTVDDWDCMKNLCNPKTGQCAMTNFNEGQPCDDGDWCTLGDACQNGSCNGVWSCECKADADCAAKSAGKLCAGSFYCAKAVGTCVLNPATIVTCSTYNDTQCAKNTCNDSTGACEMKAAPNGTACSDGDDICTLEDTCYAGECKPGADTCECRKDTDCLVLEDGNLCNGTLYCDKSKGKCIVNPTTLVTCYATFDTSCSKNRCIAATGTCQQFPDNETKSCDPGTGVMGECTAGQCKGKTSSPARYACSTDADCLQYNGGNKCVPMACDPTDKVCNRIPGASCDSSQDGECAYQACDPATGQCSFFNRFEGTSCELGTGICSNGVCK